MPANWGTDWLRLLALCGLVVACARTSDADVVDAADADWATPLILWPSNISAHLVRPGQNTTLLFNATGGPTPDKGEQALTYWVTSYTGTSSLPLVPRTSLAATPPAPLPRVSSHLS